MDLRSMKVSGAELKMMNCPTRSDWLTSTALRKREYGSPCHSINSH